MALVKSPAVPRQKPRNLGSSAKSTTLPRPGLSPFLDGVTKALPLMNLGGEGRGAGEGGPGEANRTQGYR